MLVLGRGSRCLSCLLLCVDMNPFLYIIFMSCILHHHVREIVKIHPNATLKLQINELFLPQQDKARQTRKARGVLSTATKNRK